MMPKANGYEWSRDDRFTDASGKLLARILCWDAEGVHMERWKRTRPLTKTRFTLPEKFFAESPSCGWRKG